MKQEREIYQERENRMFEQSVEAGRDFIEKSGIKNTFEHIREMLISPEEVKTEKDKKLIKGFMNVLENRYKEKTGNNFNDNLNDENKVFVRPYELDGSACLNLDVVFEVYNKKLNASVNERVGIIGVYASDNQKADFYRADTYINDGELLRLWTPFGSHIEEEMIDFMLAE